MDDQGEKSDMKLKGAVHNMPDHNCPPEVELVWRDLYPHPPSWLQHFFS